MYKGQGELNENEKNNSRRSSEEKWWNLSAQQTSKLEISQMSNSFGKKVYAVADYFTQKSELPHDLANRDQGYSINDYKNNGEQFDNKQTITKRFDPNNFTEENNSNDSNNFTLTSNTLTERTTSSDFSFTLNSSDTGDFIQRKPGMNSDARILNAPHLHNPSPFLITKMLNRKTLAEAAAVAAKEAAVLKLQNPSNLKTIGKPLIFASNDSSELSNHTQ